MASGSIASKVTAPEPLLRVRGLTKTFPGLKALDDVSLTVHPGEIVGVVGHNGSGKSTLVKILAGVYRSDPGAILEVRDATGQIVTGESVRDELHFIHQDLGLIDSLTAVENLDLGRALRAHGMLPVRGAAETRRAQQLISRFGASFDVSLPVGRLSPAERAIVAIARALDGWARPDNVLILDEPTTAFHGDEVQRLFDAIRHVASAGAGIVFISHRVDEVLGLANRVVALRDGQVVANEPVGRLDHDRMVQLIAGRAIAELRVARGPREAEPVLEVQGLTGGEVVDLSFSLRPGEILGVSGLLGSGREQLASLLFGAHRRTGGRVVIDRRELPAGDVPAAIHGGMAFVPVDRRRNAAVMDMSMRENLTLAQMGSLRRRFGRLDGRAEQSEARAWAQAVALSPADPERPLRLFSGGNQQKVVLAKWLRIEPRVLLLDEPTQGVDVGAKAAIYELLLGAARAETGVLVCSSDIKELVLLCDRVLVLDSGRLHAEVPRGSLSEARLLREELGMNSANLAADRAREAHCG
jgi:ABC-type sugar transport system ATPase subunit